MCRQDIPKPAALDPLEPANVANAIHEMDLDYVVITSVDRDDVADGGAGHFAECIRQVRIKSPKTMVEVLIPDFSGHIGHLLKVIEAQLDVIAHNVETVERLTKSVRDPERAINKHSMSYNTSSRLMRVASLNPQSWWA